MQSDLAAARLISRFLELFTGLGHDKIIERLARLVMAEPAISRLVLCSPRSNQIRVEAVARGDDCQLPGINYRRLHNIPHRQLLKAMGDGKAFAAELLDERHQGTQCLPGTRAVFIQPISHRGAVLGTFYLESTGPLRDLKAAVQNLASVWTFSAFLMHHLLELRRHQRKSAEYLRAEQALWASDFYLNAILSDSPALISVKDLNGNIMLASERYRLLAELHENGGDELFDGYPMELARNLWDSDGDPLKSAQVIESELQVRHKDGALHTYMMLKFPLRDEHGEIFSVCSICTDITERKLAEDAVREQHSRLNFMSFHDVLTGLPNRSLFYDRLNQGLSRARRNGGHLAVMMIDVDRFKNVNDSLGRDAGDRLLKIVAGKVKSNLRQTDTVARIGGDEFVVILESMSEPGDVHQVAIKLLNCLAQPIELDGRRIQSSASIGISLFPGDGQASDELLKRADVAMHKAKASGKNNYLHYTEGMDETAVNFLLVEKDLRTAIEEEQLCLHYQPQVDLETGDLVGVEALVRWMHPQRGLIAPAHFVPLAEETGLIVPLGEWLLRKAGAQQRAWMESGKYVGRIAVNISPRQLRQPQFAERLGTILDEVGLPPKYLELEITESSAMEQAGETVNTLSSLNQMGLSLAIDDFGTGYSSLVYLKRFPIQKLKIDRSFIQDIHTDQNDASIAHSIIGLAHNMMLNVVAEGVENEHQADWLRKRGCDQAQGYLYAQPVPPEKLESLFSAGTASFRQRNVEPELPF